MQQEQRDEEFSRLRGVVYADHAGAGLHSDRQALEVARLLNEALVCNPHSSPQAARQMDEAAEAVLRFLGADPRVYSLVWTSGATAALKMVGENLDWGAAPAFVYHRHSHNSVLGIREYARAAGAAVAVFETVAAQDTKKTESGRCSAESRGEGEEDAEETEEDGEMTEEGYEVIGGGPVASLASLRRGLVAIPGQCNFSGRREDPAALRRRLHPDVLLLVDGASLAASSPVDIAALGCDFFVLSFYKLFGLPSGLGALVCHTERTEKNFAPKRFFGGGTVEASSATDTGFVRFRKSLAKRLQDGTPPFLSILSLRVGFSEMFRFFDSMTAIQKHTFSLARNFATQLRSLAHFNGQKMAVLYGEWENAISANVWRKRQGPIVALNLRDSSGHFIGYAKVEKFGAISAIRFRSGCFCNPGACETFLGLSANRVSENHLLLGKVCGDESDILAGKPTGCVRVSFGWSSTERDVQKLLAFFRQWFLETAPPPPTARALAPVTNDLPKVEEIFLFPIKSCAGQRVARWPLGQRGPKFDRQWALVETLTGAVMTQKTFAKMTLLRPVVSLEQKTLTLNGELEIDISQMFGEKSEVEDIPETVGEKSVSDLSFSCSSDAGIIPWRDDDGQIRTFLQMFFGIECFLARVACGGKSFANEAPLLVVSRESVSHLNAEFSMEISAARFRPNLVLAGGPGPHWEDDYSKLCLVEAGVFLGAEKQCARCEMVNVDQDTGLAGPEPLRSLSRYRRRNGKIFFGSLFSLASVPRGEVWLEVGSSVQLG